MSTSRTFFLTLLVALLGLWWFAARNKSSDTAQDIRPNDPWVFRSVLDKQPRMITMALNDHLWVSYSTDSCSLYKAWAGGVDFEGAVYNMRHGPQPMSLGNAWFENASRQPWEVISNGQSEVPRTDYKGHRYTEDGHTEIMYDLVLASGQRIRVNERPEYVERSRQKGFQRVFTMENAPTGVQVNLKLNVSSIADASNLETDGVWKSTKIEDDHSQKGLFAKNMSGALTLNNNGSTQVTTYFVSSPLVPNPFDAERKAEEEPGAAISPGEKLMAKSDCRTCHNPKVQTVGPGYVQIAERYKNEPANIEKLTQKVIKGGSGTFGIAAMSAHPDLTPEDAKAMIAYVLSFDEGEDDGEGSTAVARDISSIPENKWLKPETGVADKDMLPGLLANVFVLTKSPNALADVNFKGTPSFKAIVGKVEAAGADFGELKNNFALEVRGYLYLEKDDNIVLQLSSDDGTKLYLDDQMLINNDGPHGMEPKEAEVAIRAGFHHLRIEYFQGGGGQGISLKWARFGQSAFKTIPEQHFSHKRGDNTAGAVPLGGQSVAIPGDGTALKDVHPSYRLTQARPDEFLPKVAGMDFLPDGRLLVTTWDALGAVYVLENVASGDPKKIKVKRIAQGLAEPLGIKVVDGEIYVLQKQELTKLVDKNGDDIIDEYQCFAKGWKASANFHEFAFGLAYKDDYFYACLAIAINPGGASTRPQVTDRGKVLKISRKDGSIEFIARGLRTPNGINIGPDGELFVADNQGDWLPSSKILHVKPGAFYNSFAVDSAAVAQLPIQQPVVWLPQDEIGNSPTQPILLNDGPYQNQLLHGDVCYGGLQRVFMEKINDNYQGAVFRFSQGLEGGTNRLVRGPDGALYVGCIGNPGNWSQQDKLWYGLQRLEYNQQSTFEMLAVRAKSDGIEIEFTEPLREGDGWDPAHYQVKQWWYKPTVEYGGPKMDEQNLSVSSASVSADRKKVFLEIPGIQSGHVVNLHLRNLPISDLGHEIWTTDCWYTMNAIPANLAGEKRARPVFAAPLDNTLSEQEKAAGWALLFDGKSIQGWHNYGKNTIGSSWIIQDNALHLDAQPNPSGHWQAADGGDILTAEEYQDFEFTLEWKIGPCGNSGIFYNVTEDPAKFQYGWMTGMEMQVLDNTCHPDSRIPKHRAGDLYDLIACKYETVKPSGEWNRIRIISKNGHLEHWLNDRKVVETQLFTPEWNALIAGSKFKEFKGFGQAKKGKISLQDHGDPVWYKNIKIRRL
jgi:cytochrome c